MFPGALEAKAQPVTGLRVEGAVGIATGDYRPEGRLLATEACQLISEQSKQDIVAFRPDARMPLEARARTIV